MGFRHDKTAAAKAFTMVEIIVVMVIIMILAAIMVPVVGHVKERAIAVKSKARLSELATGAMMYKQRHGYYPGQRYASVLKGEGGAYTGSQVLAACLAGYTYAQIAAAHPLSSVSPGSPDIFCPFAADDLVTVAGADNSTSDRFPPIDMAFLYFPARLGADAGSVTEVFKFGDNSDYVLQQVVYGRYRRSTSVYPGCSFNSYGDYTDEAEGKGIHTVFEGEHFATDPNAGAARRADSFLLIGPGLDRAYFTDDDLVSW